MTFKVDRKEYRTYDPERGYELFIIGGGSDGMQRFKLAGPNGEGYFTATSIGQSLRADEIAFLGRDYSKRTVVWCVMFWSDDWKSLIREALTAYLINHGSPLSGSEAFVRFGPDGSVFDDRN